MQRVEILASPTAALTYLLSILPGILETSVIDLATLLSSLTLQRL